MTKAAPPVFSLFWVFSRARAALLAAGLLSMGPLSTGRVWAAESAPRAAEAPAAFDVRVENAEGAGRRETRLVFTLNACVEHRVYVLDQPARAVADLPEVKFLIDPSHGAPKQSRRRAKSSSLSDRPLSYRFGRLSPGRSRIIVDLPGPFEVSASCAQKNGMSELILAIKPTDPAAFRAAARAGAEAQTRETLKQETLQQTGAESTAATAPPAAVSDQQPLIVLDPGHGGVDAGTIGPDNVIEKDVVLDFAKALAGALRAGGHYRVAFTREDDTFVPLQARVRIAQKLGAALFVSLHADSLPGAQAGAHPDIRGATVYTASDRASDAEAARVAESENQADALAGQEAQEQAGEVNDILFDLTRRETRAFSNIFAQYLSERWKIAATLNKNPRRHAGFVVLKAPDVPSVLLELGYLSSAQDAAELTSPQWREKAAAQAAQAIDDFFASRRAAPVPAALAPAALAPAALTEPRSP